MALTQYRDLKKNITISKRMGAPKKVERMEAWLKEARKVIPQIPSVKDTDWQITHQLATSKRIIFEMHNSIGEACTVEIDRTQSLIGG